LFKREKGKEENVHKYRKGIKRGGKQGGRGEVSPVST